MIGILHLIIGDMVFMDHDGTTLGMVGIGASDGIGVITTIIITTTIIIQLTIQVDFILTLQVVVEVM
jgi:hypothetical protein